MSPLYNINEFYTERQGRPGSHVSLDMEERGPSIPPGYIKGVMLSASVTTTNITINYDASDHTVILVDGGPVTVTLPEAVLNTGKYYYIKKISADGADVTIKGYTSAETIDGEEQIYLTLQYSYVMVVCTGSVWYIMGGGNVKLETIVEVKFDEQNNLLEQLLNEVRQSKLHLASMSDQTTTGNDGQTED